MLECPEIGKPYPTMMGKRLKIEIAQQQLSDLCRDPEAL
jgi:hypothetical protein